MKKEINLFLTALMFYTRIPVPKNLAYSDDLLNKSTRYFPLIGWIVGSIIFSVFYLSSYLFGSELSIIIALLSGVLVTGSFHEDGLADVFDGFGGGWSKEKILDIMKDSRLGTYGVTALIFLYSIKFFSLKEFINVNGSEHIFILWFVFINYHTLSRLIAISITFTSSYSRADASSKSKPIAKENTKTEVILAFILGLIPLMILGYFKIQFLLVLAPLFLLYFFSQRYFNKWIDGYTGDCLGAIQQIAECVCIISFILIWKFM